MKRTNPSIREAIEEGSSERILSEHDPFYALLHTSDPYSHMPEVYDLLGPALFAKFLDTFEGLTLRIPTKQSLSVVLRKQSAFYEYYVLRTPQREIVEKYGVNVIPSEEWMKDLYPLYRPDTFSVRKDVSGVTLGKRRIKKVKIKMTRNRFSGGQFPPRSLVPFPGGSQGGGAGTPPPVDPPDDDLMGTPSSLLDAMARWLIGGSADGDLDLMRGYLNDHRRRHEVYTVGLANARAVWLTKVASALWDNLFDVVFNPATIRALSPKDKAHLLDITYKMFSSESQAQWNFYKNGPTTLPPLEDPSQPQVGHGTGKYAQVLETLDKMDPQSREKVRNAFSAFTSMIAKVNLEPESTPPPVQEDSQDEEAPEPDGQS